MKMKQNWTKRRNEVSYSTLFQLETKRALTKQQQQELAALSAQQHGIRYFFASLLLETRKRPFFG